MLDRAPASRQGDACLRTRSPRCEPLQSRRARRPPSARRTVDRRPRRRAASPPRPAPVRRGCRGGSGSGGSVDVQRAPQPVPTGPPRSSAARSTMPPRATFTTVAPSGSRRRAARPRRPRVASVRPAATTRCSDSRSRRVSETGRAPFPRTLAAVTYGSWTSSRGPKGRRRRAVSRPIRPKPRRPTVRPRSVSGPAPSRCSRS